jgi:hypothetical protein
MYIACQRGCLLPNEMEPENSNAFKRSSMHQALYSGPVERRSSKKSSSRDRHGMVYPDSFRETTIRTVTPESHSSANHSPLSEPEHLTGGTLSSPRNTVRSRPIEPERRRDFNKHSSGAGEEDPPVEARSQRARSRTTAAEEQRNDIAPSTFKARTRVGSINTASPSQPKLPAPQPKLPEDPSSSIGFPSIESPKIQQPDRSSPSNEQSCWSSHRRSTKSRFVCLTPLWCGSYKNPAVDEDYLR